MCNLDTDEALKIHIEGLQATLTKRNARIKELEEKLAQPVDLPEKVDKLVKKAYKLGWKNCALELEQTTGKLVLALKEAKEEAWQQFLRTEIQDV